MTKTFVCHSCGKRKETERTHEQAMAEMVEDFGEVARKLPFVVLCDDCYNDFMNWDKANQRNQ